MASLDIKIRCVGHTELLSVIEEMSDYVKSACVGDEFADLASDIGELDVDECLRLTTEFQGDIVDVVVEPKGDLIKLIDEYKRIVI